MKPGSVVSVGSMRAFYTDGNEGPMYTFADGSRAREDVVPADPARPLVVIDPEDREQVKRLTSLLGWALAPGDATELAAALREFADPKPPKPAEPTGLGAVVEDADGAIWVRTPAKVGYSSDRPDWWYSDNGASTPHWDYIQAVRVLSEGVTA